MSELYIGLMSGTSADGIDAALVDFQHAQPQLIATHYVPYPTQIRQAIFDLCQPGADEINRLGVLDVLLGKAFASAANTLLQKNNLTATAVRAIGSHGQTVRHHPTRQFSLQIGDPNIIASETGITTVADFRRRDMAHGGQGAPLVPAFHQAIFASDTIDRAIVNIGGIANITLLPAHAPQSILGFDTGPGNTLLDGWVEKHLQKSYDEKGVWAAQGKVDEDLLKNLLSDPFFKMGPPKSTGREHFNFAWLKNFLLPSMSAVNIQATLVELTARTIIDAIKNYFSGGEILVCGGGVHNELLMKRLRELAAPLTVDSAFKYGIAPDWVEAIAFAWLAKQTLEKTPGNIPAVTGARKAAILGGVYY
jgi:anhydro-N-acetylmuramic acid kinase